MLYSVDSDVIKMLDWNNINYDILKIEISNAILVISPTINLRKWVRVRELNEYLCNTNKKEHFKFTVQKKVNHLIKSCFTGMSAWAIITKTKDK